MLVRYLGQRLAFAGVALLGVVIVAFLVAHLVPADPLAVVLSDTATKDPRIRAQYMKRWGLDRPLPEQFLYYLANVAHGNLGESFTTRRPVLEDLVQYVPATVELSIAAFAVSVVFGVPLGVWAALRHNRSADHAARFISLVGAASPIFWTGLIALYVFYYLLRWAPGPGRLDPHQVLPPVVTGFLLLDSLIAGAVLTETVFAWPGIGRYAVTAATRLDYPAILGVTLLTGVIYIVVNFIVDLLYGVLDPRIRV